MACPSLHLTGRPILAPSLAWLTSLLALAPVARGAAASGFAPDDRATPPAIAVSGAEFAPIALRTTGAPPARTAVPLFEPLPGPTNTALSNELASVPPTPAPLFTPLIGLASATAPDSSGGAAGGTRPLFLPLTNSVNPAASRLLGEYTAGTNRLVPASGGFAAVAAPGRPERSLLEPPGEPFTLGPGDRVDLQLIGDPTSLTPATVGPDGKIYFNLLPGLDVWGLTPAQTKALLEREFLKFMRDKPQVSVILRGVESRRVWLLGRLHLPGVYPLATPMTLLEALTRAGGPLSPARFASLGGGPLGSAFSQDFADLRRSFVVRNGEMVPVDFYALLKQGDLSQNIYLRPGDFVYLAPAVTQEVFVLGAVSEPQAVVCRGRMTLVTAIASAQGTVKNAYPSHVAVVRGSLTDPKIMVVNYKAITRGHQPDVLLEPGDIVYVPFSPFRTIERYVNLILNTFVTTVGINEGSRFVSGNVPPVGVSIGGSPTTSGGSQSPP